MTRRLLQLAVAILLAPAAAQAAECRGTDLMPVLGDNDPTFVAALERTAAATPFRQGRLFRLDREGRAPSWVYGTVHSSDPRVVDLAAPVREAFEGAETVALELDTDPTAGNPFAGMAPDEIRRLLIAPPGETVDKLLSPDDLQTLEAAAVAYGYPAPLVRVMRPSVLATFLSLPVCAASPEAARNILDVRLLHAAKEAGKPVHGLETLSEQLSAMGTFPIEVQRELIRATVRYLGHAEDMLETLLVMYGRGDLGLLNAWIRSERPIPTIDAAVPSAFYDTLIDDRNARMVERAKPLLEEGGVFLAVGAAHLAGETGILRGFERAGYRVTPVL